MKAALLYSNFMTADGAERKIGGVETYLLELALVLKSMDIEPIVYQWAQSAFELESEEGFKILGLPVMNLSYHKRPQALYDRATQDLNMGEDLIVFGYDMQSVKTDYRRSVSIQHGIAWDLPSRFLTGRKFLQSGVIGKIYKRWLHRRFMNYYERCPNRVCVDYNFINWYRTNLPEAPTGHNWVIPNFGRIATPEQIANKPKRPPVKIIFARRFVEFRGTRVIGAAARAILNKYPEVRFTFAGEGPDETWLKQTLGEDPRVTYTKYKPHETLDIHLEHHIAVVPSLASEGTSLSLAEAMGAGCAVIASNVGGMTNMVVDGYNGLLVAPESEDFVNAIGRLLDDSTLLERLAANGHHVAAQAFSIEEWRERWRLVIQTLTAQ